jgi:COMPASS component SWD3
VKFIEEDPHLFLSGGWDGTMFLWDVRTHKAAKSIFGPFISGDTIDV